ncbi:MAG TPA: preprotein translocase subunit SecE [Myxococcota bacterium]|jgi:preprotein translocase SecE subunit
MKTKSTIVGIFFVVSGIILAWVLSLAFATLFGQLRVNDTPIGGIDKLPLSRLAGIVAAAAVGIGCYVWPKTKNFIGDCAEELNKVNWPSWGETKVSTLVVIITSVISAAILGVFDITFQILSNWLASHV